MPDPSQSAQLKRSRLRGAVGGVLVALLLGAIGSGIWDLLFRPGLSRVAGVVTGTWSRADNAVFSSAALDPRSLPDLITLALVAAIPSWFAIWFLMETFLMPVLLRRMKPVLLGHDDVAKKKVRSRLKLFTLLGAVVMSIMFAFGQVGYSIANESIWVWRVFHRNLDICRPYLTQQDQDNYLAEFRQMKRRSDFELICNQLETIASSHSMHLEWTK